MKLMYKGKQWSIVTARMLCGSQVGTGLSSVEQKGGFHVAAQTTEVNTHKGRANDETLTGSRYHARL